MKEIPTAEGGEKREQEREKEIPASRNSKVGIEPPRDPI